MKFVTVCGFFATIVFNGFNLGQPLEVTDVRSDMVTLFNNFRSVIGKPAESNTKALLDAFNDPNKKYPDIATLTKAAQDTFRGFKTYFELAGYYKKKGQEKQLEALNAALNEYETSLSSRLSKAALNEYETSLSSKLSKAALNEYEKPHSSKLSEDETSFPLQSKIFE